MCYNEAHVQLCIMVAVEYPLVSYVSLSQSAAYYCDFTAQFIYFATCDCVHENEQYVGTIFPDFYGFCICMGPDGPSLQI